MNPLYVSFFTDAYREHADGLVASLDANGLEHRVEYFHSRDGWLANVNVKPQFLLSVRRDVPDRPLVWLDADARVRQPPTLFDTLACDFAAHWRHGVELLSGSMYFGPTQGAERLLRAWAIRCEEHPTVWDQVNLANTLADMSGEVSVERLPASYTRIFDAADMGPEVVVEHLQASRQLRNR